MLLYTCAFPHLEEKYNYPLKEWHPHQFCNNAKGKKQTNQWLNVENKLNRDVAFERFSPSYLLFIDCMDVVVQNNEKRQHKFLTFADSRLLKL